MFDGYVPLFGFWFVCRVCVVFRVVLFATVCFPCFCLASAHLCIMVACVCLCCCVVVSPFWGCYFPLYVVVVRVLLFVTISLYSP